MSRHALPLVIVAVLAIAITGLLMPIPYKGRAVVAMGDLAHAPIFGGLALATLILLQQFRPFPNSETSRKSTRLQVIRRCVIVFFAFFSAGIAIEFAQAMSGRTAAVHDVISNGLGIFAAILWWVSFFLRRLRSGARWDVRVLWAAAGFLLAIAWWRPVAMLHDVYKVRAEFPRLASFETKTELQRWYFRACQGSRSRADATDGKYSLELTCPPATHSGATLVELNADWSKMRTLEMDVVLDGEKSESNLQFLVKVVDETHQTPHTDTYRGQWTIFPGQPKHVTISREAILAGPDDRETNLSRIQYVDVMILNPTCTTVFRVDDIRLTQ